MATNRLIHWNINNIRMKLIEQVKLRHRAYKYEYVNDVGGIAYVKSVIKQGQTVMDIGSHKAGYLTFMLKQVGDKGKVFAFEPQSHLYEYIKKCKSLFKWDNVTIEHLALSDLPGTVTLYTPIDEAGKVSTPGATIVEHEDKSRFGITEQVSAETLDAYCDRNHVEPDFLKIDVEGNELRVFKGGLNTLKKYKPKIIVEIDSRQVGKEKVFETFNFLQTLSYTGYFISGKERIPIAEFSVEKHQASADMKKFCYNFVFE